MRFHRWHWRSHRTWYAFGAAAATAAAISVPLTTGSSTPTPVPAVTAQPTVPGSDLGVGCGVERWAVKTLTDPLAGRVDTTPVDGTVAQLRALPAPVSPTGRVAAEEVVWRIRATVFEYKEEADSDIHLALKDAQGNTMIAEIPLPACMTGSIAANDVARVRAEWLAVHPVSTSYTQISQSVTLTGVAFFDRIHGQAGVAPNGIELHPVLSLVLG